MEKCQLSYIPDRLHRNMRPVINEFEVDEFLYRRCTTEVLENPFKSISITELSHNRSGLNSNLLSYPEDSLYNINQNNLFERFPDFVVCSLVIKSLNETGGYLIEFSEQKNDELFNCKMELLHEPEECMYPHSVFRVWINGEIITYNNYKSTLDKLHKIRSFLKKELATMIYRREVTQP